MVKRPAPAIACNSASQAWRSLPNLRQQPQKTEANSLHLLPRFQRPLDSPPNAEPPSSRRSPGAHGPVQPSGLPPRQRSAHFLPNGYARRRQDHAVEGEITLVQCEERLSCPSCVSAGRFLLHKAGHADRAFPSRQLLGEACRWFWAAVGIADQRPERCCVDDGCYQTSFYVPYAKLRTQCIDIAIVCWILGRFHPPQGHFRVIKSLHSH